MPAQTLEIYLPFFIILPQASLLKSCRVTDLYLSWWKNVEHARTTYYRTCGTEYQQPYRRCKLQTPYSKWNKEQARLMNVSFVPRSLQSWASTTPRWYSQPTFFFQLFWSLISIKSAMYVSVAYDWRGVEKQDCMELHQVFGYWLT